MQDIVSQPDFLSRQICQMLQRICVAANYPLDTEYQKTLLALIQQTISATQEGIIAVPLAEFDQADITTLTDSPVLGAPGEYAPLILEQGHIWLNRYWQYENRLSSSLCNRLRDVTLSAEQTKRISNTLAQWRAMAKQSTEIDWQQRAIALAALSHVSIISGGPGTGKTTTVTRLLWLLTEQLQISPKRVLLAAPTGKAAMRLQESIRQAKTTLNIPTAQAEQIPEQASTLHRLLGYIPGKVSFRHHRHNTLPADLVIIDEASMIDISLMTHLFEAVPPNARLILLGDKDQLASVETGSIFRDLCHTAANQHSPNRQQQLDQLCGLAKLTEADTAPTPIQTKTVEETSPSINDHIIVLQKSWRFRADSGIGQLSAAVRDGNEKQLDQILQQQWKDIQWTADGNLQTDGLLLAWEEYFRLLDNAPKTPQQDKQWLQRIFAAFNRFRILTPLRKGNSGTEQLNQLLNQAFRRRHHNATGNTWYAGRPVMVTQNDYRQQLFNGDIGLTLKDSQGELRVWFPEEDDFRAVSPVRLPNHETAWAMTIHKSQGSEFEEVLLLLPEDEEVRILGRELLYTGITRAKSKIQLQGRPEVIHAAMQRVTPPSSLILQRIARSSDNLSSLSG